MADTRVPEPVTAEALVPVSTEPYATPVSPALLIDLALLTLLLICGLAMIRMRRLFGVAMLSGIYSLLSAAFFVSLDAVDVAFTEAAVGAGVSTVLFLSGMALTAKRESPVSRQRVLLPLAIVTIVGAALLYATIDMPAFGDPNSPANAYVGQAYIERAPEDIEVPNIVTAVLASYRGYDTLGEVLVVFTAGLACLLLLGAGSIRGGRRVTDEPPEEGTAAEPAAQAMPLKDGPR
jgi:multicomponent Na+:H+ antiporter subunit B